MRTAFLLNLALSASVAAALSFSSRLFGPKRRLEGEKGLPYEAGMPPMAAGLGPFPVSYCRFAVLFVIFDVDLAFLIPFVLLRGELDLRAMAAMSAFVALVGFTLAYVWRKGALSVD